jgi:hypothetical protein
VMKCSAYWCARGSSNRPASKIRSVGATRQVWPVRRIRHSTAGCMCSPKLDSVKHFRRSGMSSIPNTPSSIKRVGVVVRDEKVVESTLSTRPRRPRRAFSTVQSPNAEHQQAIVCVLSTPEPTDARRSGSAKMVSELKN